jgi:hypothetical protein
LRINNASSGNDITGTTGWSVSNAGVGTFASLVAASVTGASTLTLAAAGGNAVTIGSGSNTVTIAKAATFSSTITVTDGQSTFISSSNAAPTVLVTNNTVTSYGSGGAGSGVFVIRSTSLTTGDLLKLQTDNSLTSGYFIDCYNTDTTASVFSVGLNGATTIVGSAYATAALSITSGDLVLSAGKINQTAVGATTTNGFTGVYNGLTTGKAMSLSHTTSTIANGGSMLDISSTGVDTASSSGVLLNLASTASTAGTQVLATFSALTTGIAQSIVVDALTTGQGLKISSASSTIADGGSLLRLASGGTNTGGATNGTMLDIITTAQVAGVMVNIGSALTTGTAVLVTSSAAMTTTGNLLTLTANSATTAAGILRVNANALTDGMGAVIASSSTVLTSTGRLFLVNHSGNAGVSTVIAEVKSAATDETVVFQVLGSAALAAGKLVNLSAASMTTGTGLDMSNLNALTSGTGINVVSNSTDTSARNLVYIKNDNVAAVGAIPLTIANDAVIATKFVVVAKFGTSTVYNSIDNTEPDAALTGVKGDICLNAVGGSIAVCTSNGSNWTTLS